MPITYVSRDTLKNVKNTLVSYELLSGQISVQTDGKTFSFKSDYINVHVILINNK